MVMSGQLDSYLYLVRQPEMYVHAYFEESVTQSQAQLSMHILLYLVTM